MLTNIRHEIHQHEDEVTADFRYRGNLYRISLCKNGGEIWCSFWMALIPGEAVDEDHNNPVPFGYRYMTARGGARQLLIAIGHALIELGDTYYSGLPLVLKAADRKRVRVFRLLAEKHSRFRVELAEE